MSEATPEDRVEQLATPTRDSAPSRAFEAPVEADPADVVEQAVQAGPGEHRVPRDLPEGGPWWDEPEYR